MINHPDLGSTDPIPVWHDTRYHCTFTPFGKLQHFVSFLWWSAKDEVESHSLGEESALQSGGATVDTSESLVRRQQDEQAMDGLQ